MAGFDDYRRPMAYSNITSVVFGVAGSIDGGICVRY